MPQMKLPLGALEGRRWFPRTLNPAIAEAIDRRPLPTPDPLEEVLVRLGTRPAPKEFPTAPLPLWENPPGPADPPSPQALLPFEIPDFRTPTPTPPMRPVRDVEAPRDLALEPVGFSPIPDPGPTPRQQLLRKNAVLPPIDEDLVQQLDPQSTDAWWEATRGDQTLLQQDAADLVEALGDPALQARAHGALRSMRERTSPEAFADLVKRNRDSFLMQPPEDLDPAQLETFRRRLPEAITQDLEAQATTARSVAPRDPGDWQLPDPEAPKWSQVQRAFDAQARAESSFYADRPGEVFAIPTPARRSLLEDEGDLGPRTTIATRQPDRFNQEQAAIDARRLDDEAARTALEDRNKGVSPIPGMGGEPDLEFWSKGGPRANPESYADTGVSRDAWDAPKGPTFGMGQRVRLADGREGRVRQMLRSRDEADVLTDLLGSFGSGTKDRTRHEMLTQKGTRPTQVFGPDGQKMTIEATGLTTVNVVNTRAKDLAGKTLQELQPKGQPLSRQTLVRDAEGRLYVAAETGLQKAEWPQWKPAIKPVIVDLDDGSVARVGADQLQPTGEWEFEKGKRLTGPSSTAEPASAAPPTKAKTIRLKGSGREFEWTATRGTPVKVGVTREGVDKVQVEWPSGQKSWIEVPKGAKTIGRGKEILGQLVTGGISAGALGGLLAGGQEEDQPAEGDRPQAEAGLLGRALVRGVQDRLGPATEVLAALRAAREKPKVTQQLSPVQRAITAAYDATHPLKADVKRLSKGPVPDEINLEYKLQGLGGALGAAEGQFRAIGRVVDDLDKVGLVKQLEDLATLRQAARAWRVARERLGSFDAEATAASRSGAQGASTTAREKALRLQEHVSQGTVAPLGLTEEAIAQQEAALRAQVGEEGFAQLEAGLRDIYAQTAEVTKRRYEAGLIAPEAYQRYQLRGEDYIPFKRVMEDLDEQGNPIVRAGLTRVGQRQGKSVSVRDTIDEEMFGSDRPGKNPILSAVEYVEDGTREIHLNKVGKAYVQWAQDYALPELQGQVTVSARPPKAVGADQGVIAFHEAGKPMFITMPKLHADVLQMAHLQDVQQAFAFLKGFRGPWQAMVTAASPAFALKQGFMDPIEAFAVMPWKKSLLRTAPTFAKNLGKAARAAWKDATTGELTPERQAWFEAGGSMSGVSGMNQTAERRAFGERNDPSLMNRVVEPIKRILTSPQEDTVKMASYWTMLDQGASPEEAMWASRKFGGTPDAYQKGSKIAKYEAILPFLNITIQGLGRTYEAAARNPMRMAGVLFAAAAAQSYLDRRNAAFTNPDTGTSFWDDITPEDKEKSWIVFLDGEPQRAEDGRLYQPNLRIPKPPGLRTLLGTAGAAMESGLDPVDRLLKGVNANLPGADIPITREAPLRSAGYRAIGSVNPLPKWAFEELANVKTFTGAPIVGQRVSGYFPELQKTGATSAVATGIADLLGHAISPARVDHTLETFLPGLGEMGLSAIDALVDQSPQGARSPQEAAARAPVVGPMVRPFVGPLRSAERKHLGDVLSEASTTSQMATQSLNRLMQTGDVAGLQTLLDERPEALQQRAVNPAFGGIQRQLSALARMREMALEGRLGLEGQALTAYLGQLGQAERALQLQGEAIARALGQESTLR